MDCERPRASFTASFQPSPPDGSERFCANSEIADLGIEITCVFAGFDGESYADIPTVHRTVGLVPPATRAARTQELKEISNCCSGLQSDPLFRLANHVSYQSKVDNLDRILFFRNSVFAAGHDRVKCLCLVHVFLALNRLYGMSDAS